MGISSASSRPKELADRFEAYRAEQQLALPDALNGDYEAGTASC